jgi:hypothetical protein
MRLPDFVLIGAAKAGTTSLYALLDRHPDIFMPKVKEPEFFARDDRYAEGIESYAAAFAAAAPGQIAGEASTIYSLSPLFPKTAERIAAHIPQARIIYVMREPVSRAYSYYVQIIKNYQNVTRDPAVHRSFEEFVLPERRAGAAPRDKVFSRANAHLPDIPELCLAGSDYVTQIEAYLAHFPPEQCLFLTFEDFVSDRPACLRKITDFLGVAPLDPAVFEEESVTRNVSEDHFRAWDKRMRITRMQERAGGLWALRQVLPRGLRETLKARMLERQASRTAHIPPKMTDATRTLLVRRYRMQMPRVRALTGLDFTAWGEVADTQVPHPARGLAG